MDCYVVCTSWRETDHTSFGPAARPRLSTPACVSSTQMCVMNSPPLARASRCARSSSDGETYSIISAQKSERTFHRDFQLSCSIICLLFGRRLARHKVLQVASGYLMNMPKCCSVNESWTTRKGRGVAAGDQCMYLWYGFLFFMCNLINNFLGKWMPKHVEL